MRCLVLIALMVSFSGPAWATDSKSTPPPANAKTSVLFMQLRAVGEFDSAKIRLLENVIVGELHKYRKFKVLARQDVENLLDADGFKQAIDCEAQSCLVNVAGALGTDLMVSGELGYMDKKTAVLSLQILHTGDNSYFIFDSGN